MSTLQDDAIVVVVAVVVESFVVAVAVVVKLLLSLAFALRIFSADYVCSEASRSPSISKMARAPVSGF